MNRTGFSNVLHISETGLMSNLYTIKRATCWLKVGPKYAFESSGAIRFYYVKRLILIRDFVLWESLS